MPPVNDQTPRSKSCMNHLKHGATATTLFLDDENPDVFFELLEDAFEEHKPASKQSAGIVTRTVHDQWILLRRERACDRMEYELHLKKQHPADWNPSDIHEMELLDRYRTTAARAYSRSLNDLYKLKKTIANEDRWRQHFELQKRRFDLDLERFNLAKAKHQPPPPAEPEPDLGPEPTLEDIPIPEAAAEAPPPAGHVTQVLYIGVENKQTTIYEVTPSNADLRRTLRPSDHVTRTYNFVGSVPPEYQDLITPDAVKWGKSTSVKKTYSYQEWLSLTNE